MRAKIITWNPINTRTSVLCSSIYIKPTLEILEFFNRSPNKKAVVKITGTGSCYDNQNMFATIDKSSDIPNKRDNFFNSTGLYVITLNTLWYGFPLKNGDIEFQEGIVNDIIDYVSTCKEPSDKLNTLNVSNNDSNVSNTSSKEGYRDDTDNKPCKVVNDNSSGFDKNILLICGMSLALIMILSVNQ